ncbi:MAG: carbohydrate ABC transporter substrate-binding protein [Anaerolineae bacterium]|nr:carbohydrate ABC transporter substrate-binding protein [Anaerolineae bacterium]
MPRMKVLSVLLSVCLCLAFVSSSGMGAVSRTQAQDQVELVYWSMWTADELQAKAITESIAEYEAANPNIKINVVWNGRQNQTMLRQAINAGTPVDFMDQDADQVAGGMVAAGLGLELNEWLDTTTDMDGSTPIKDIFAPGTLHMFDRDGKTYLVPYIYNTALFFYNKDIYDQVGISEPTTWEGFLQNCEALSEAGYIPMTLEPDHRGFFGFWLAYMMSRLKGAGWMYEAAFDETGEMWNDPAVLQAAQMFQSFWDRGCLVEENKGWRYPQGHSSIIAEETAGILTGSWLPGSLIGSVRDDFRWGSFNIPAVEGGEGDASELMALVLSYMVLKDSQHPAESLDFIRFMVSEAQQRKMVEVAGVGVTRLGIDWPEPLRGAQAAAENASALFAEGDGVAAANAEYWVSVLRDPFAEMALGQTTPEEWQQKMVEGTKEFWQNN